MTSIQKNLLLVGSASAVVIPGFFLLYSRVAQFDGGTKPEVTCFNNLRNIDTAEQMWAIDNHKTTNDTPTWGDLQGSLSKTNFICPAGGTYTLAKIGQPPTCSVPEHAALYRKKRPEAWSPAQ